MVEKSHNDYYYWVYVIFCIGINYSLGKIKQFLQLKAITAESLRFIMLF